MPQRTVIELFCALVIMNVFPAHWSYFIEDGICQKSQDDDSGQIDGPENVKTW